MKSAVEQLSSYKSVHLNPSNIKTHFIGIPLIIWSLFVLLNLIPFSFMLPVVEGGIRINVAMIFTLIVLIYYTMLHVKLAFGMLLFILPVMVSSYIVSSVPSAWWVAIVVFIIGWVFQLIGHKYEKAKPAFVDDLNQLLIGPFFLMAEIYFMLGLARDLEDEITPIARDKRRAHEAKKREQI